MPLVSLGPGIVRRMNIEKNFHSRLVRYYAWRTLQRQKKLTYRHPTLLLLKDTGNVGQAEFLTLGMIIGCVQS